MDASAAVTVCALTSCSSRSVLALAAALRERGDDLSLPRRQRTRPSGTKRSKLHRPELRAHQPLDFEAKRRAEPSYFSRPPFRDDDLELPQAARNASCRDVSGHNDP